MLRPSAHDWQTLDINNGTTHWQQGGKEKQKNRYNTDPHAFRSVGTGPALGTRIRIQEGKNDPQKI